MARDLWTSGPCEVTSHFAFDKAHWVSLSDRQLQLVERQRLGLWTRPSWSVSHTVAGPSRRSRVVIP
jgi:hypothetical protein